MLNLIVKEPAPGVVVYIVSAVFVTPERGRESEREVEKDRKREVIEKRQAGREGGGREGRREGWREGWRERELYLLKYVSVSQRCV